MDSVTCNVCKVTKDICQFRINFRDGKMCKACTYAQRKAYNETEEGKIKLREIGKRFREKNKEILKEKKKEQNKIKVTCEVCNVQITKQHYGQHQQCKVHLDKSIIVK